MGNKIKPHYLCFTSGLFSIVLIIYFLINHKILEKNILALFLFLCLIFSQLFWYNPIKNSFIHKIDVIIAKINVFLFLIYTLFYKKLSIIVLFLYLLLSVLSGYAFYRGYFYSTKEWCCDEHLFNHSLLHIGAFFGAMYVFI
jgi:O-antigen ligase